MPTRTDPFRYEMFQALTYAAQCSVMSGNSNKDMVRTCEKVKDLLTEQYCKIL